MQENDLVIFTLPDGIKVIGVILHIDSDRTHVTISVEPDVNGVSLILTCTPTWLPELDSTFRILAKHT